MANMDVDVDDKVNGDDSTNKAPKRGRSDEVEDDDDDFGPVVPSTLAADTPKERKKKRVLPNEQIHLSRLPSALMYEKSYMHRDHVLHIAVAKNTHFVLTASKDGILQFWKKIPGGIEFAKKYKAHTGPIISLSVSKNGFLGATLSTDQHLKVYDIMNFDMMHLIELPFNPTTCCWIHPSRVSKGVIAVGSKDSGDIYLYKSDSMAPIHVIKRHNAPVKFIEYNETYNTVISIDLKGVIEYWSAETYEFPATDIQFKYKLDTDLYEFAKTSVLPTSLSISPNGKLFATMGADRYIRIFDFLSGKITKKYDETLQFYNDMQNSGNQMYKLDAIDFGRRMAVERDLEKASAASDQIPPSNVVFDESGFFILYPTLLGVKVINIVTNQLVRLLGKVENTERLLNIALFQGTPREMGQSAEAAMGAGLIQASGNALEGKVNLEDPTVFCCAYRKERFFCFTSREPEDETSLTTGRDVFNERPLKDHQKMVAAPQAAQTAGGAVLHTTMGDITIKLFTKETPKTVENFTTHSKNGYYNNTIFHRVIKDFMVQCGDPQGDGTGGESIWEGDFEDEFNKSLKHDRPGTVSMANGGPNTNGSQFFITTVPCPWLDNKHTVFGRVTKGMDVVHAIEKVRVEHKTSKPFEEIKIINIDVLME